MVRSCLVMLVPIGVSGHGAMYEPPSRTSLGLPMLEPTCNGGSCLWFNNGCTIGCECVGKGVTYPDHSNCDNAPEPTIAFEEKHLRTNALDDIYKDGDYTRHHPWRYPGSAIVGNPCGIAGGWSFGDRLDDDGTQPPWGVTRGALGTESKPLLQKTQWVAGSEVEVAWGIHANHGGGYQYRLCPADKEITEECFQQTPLAFIGETQWLQFGWGMDTNNRTEISAVHVGGDKVIPANSVWRKNPVPPCDTNVTLGAHNYPCTGPTFEPPIEGVWGYGLGACASPLADSPLCDLDTIVKKAFQFGVVDKVAVPDVPAGDYILQWRWDVEHGAQVWNGCSDVTIVSSGSNTKAFSPVNSCHACCPETRSICSNCTGCLNDKTGACAYCWNKLDGFAPQAPAFHCLGFEAEDGGAKKWDWGAEFEGEGWSPGCSKCWADETLCQPQLRPLDDDVLVV